MYDYDPRTFNDLKIRKGDRLRISNNRGQWLKAKKMGTNESGYVPINYIALEGTLQAEDWFFASTTRKEAERLLLHEGNVNVDGSFLVRKAESPDRPQNEFSLSVLWGTDKGEGHVKHYKIMVAKNGQYHLSKLHKFKTVTHLIENNIGQSMWDGTKILHACYRSVKPVVPGLGNNQWEIKKTSLTKLKTLGKGHFGEVWHGKWDKKIDVAVKEMNPETMKKADFIAESEILKKMNHPKLVQLLAVSTKEDPIYIVTELLENGSLKSYLEARHKANNPVDIATMVYMATQVAQGMSYLEENGYIHRDLAARNVLVGKNNVCKVADFGLAKCLNEEVYNTVAGQFPLRWTAPEALQKRVFSIKSDVWSFGILLTEIVTHGKYTPYQGFNLGSSIPPLVKFLVEEGQRIPINHLSGCPQYLYDIMMQCWREDPEKRPGFFKLHDLLDAHDTSGFYTAPGTYVDDGAGGSTAQYN